MDRANECKVFKVWQRDKYVISFHLHYNYLIKISYNTAKWSIFSFRIQKDYIFNLGILKKTIIIHLKLCLCCRYYSILSKTYFRSKKRKLVEKNLWFQNNWWVYGQKFMDCRIRSIGWTDCSKRLQNVSTPNVLTLNCSTQTS